MRRLDEFQQRHRRLAFCVAVLKKFADDGGGSLAALIAYYAFLSIFPLLLVLTTVLAYALHGDPGAQRDILDSAISQVPVIGRQIRDNVGSLHGSVVALVIGVVAALWAGLGVTQASQAAFNQAWNVPYRQRPDFLWSRLRGLALLALFGGLNVVSAGLTGVAGSARLGLAAAVGGRVLAAGVNVALFALAFRVLTAVRLSWRAIAPGALLAAVCWQVLQESGRFVLAHNLRHASEIYGTFGFVLGLIFVLVLAARVTVLACEVNVVRAQRLWPRSLAGPLTEGDRRALRAAAETEERVPGQDVSVTFE